MKNKSEHINGLLNDGFLSLSNNILNEDEINDLSIKCYEAISNCKSINYKDNKDNILNNHFEKFNNKQVINTFFRQKTRHILGVSDEIDYYIGKIITHSAVKEILNYLFLEPKCHGCLVRVADKNSIPLGIHSDGPRELTLSILLNNINEKDATTVLIKSSHLFPTSIKHKIERVSPKFFSFITTPITGLAGSLHFFLNKTAHGVKKGNDNKSIAILLGFHDNQHEEFKNLILPETTVKKFNLIDVNLLNNFESNSKNIRNFKRREANVDIISDYRELNIKERLIYNLLIFSGYIISFLKKIKSLI